MKLLMGEASPETQLGQRGLRAEGSEAGPQQLGKGRLGAEGRGSYQDGCPWHSARQPCPLNFLKAYTNWKSFLPLGCQTGFCKGQQISK